MTLTAIGQLAVARHKAVKVLDHVQGDTFAERGTAYNTVRLADLELDKAVEEWLAENGEKS